MKRTPWLISIARVIIFGFLAFVNYVSRAGTTSIWKPFQWIAELIAPNPWGWVLGVTLIGILLEFGERAINTHEFTKQRVQRILDQMVGNLFEGNVKADRCTLFKAVRGWRAFLIALWRLIRWQESRWSIFKNLLRIRLGVSIYTFMCEPREVETITRAQSFGSIRT
jgi:hypothetical protein